MDENSKFNDEDFEEDEDEFITLIDDEGRSSNFYLLDAIDIEEGSFVALLPQASYDEDADEAEYIILQVISVKGEDELCDIEDEKLLNFVDDIFQQRFEEMFNAGGLDEDADDLEGTEYL